LTKDVDKSGSRTLLKNIRDELTDNQATLIKLESIPHGEDEDSKIKTIKENYENTKNLITDIQSQLYSLPTFQSLGSIKPFSCKEDELKNIVADITKNVANTPDFLTLKTLIDKNTPSLKNAGIFPGGTDEPSEVDNENAEKFKTALANVVNDSVKQDGFKKLKDFINDNRAKFVGQGRHRTPRKRNKRRTYRKTEKI
jgi:hypothetical protein